MTIAIGQLKPVQNKGKIIGFYTLRDDGCYEAAKVGYRQAIKANAFDSVKEAKKWMLKAD